MNQPISPSRGGPKEPGSGVFERRVELVMHAVDLHHRHLHDYLYRLTRQWQDAEDILQELWRYVVVSFPEDKIQSLSLLRRKARQLFIDHYRATKRKAEFVTDTVPEPLCDTPTELRFSEKDEAGMKDRFWSEFSGIELTEMQKEVLWLHARYGYTYAEIETRVEVPSSTIGDWVLLGRQRLADYLNQ